jgi:glycerate 2-kinase
LLVELYEAAVAGAQPESGTRDAVSALQVPAAALVWIIALGKAAHAMARGAVAALVAAGREPAGGVIVAPHDDAAAHARLSVVVGDHPIPGPRSAAAAAAIGDLAARVRADDHVIVLVSGGGTSLAAAPALEVAQFGQDDLARLYAAVLASGADIVAMNAVRKRFARWSGGRLAVALAPARVHCLVVSDVLGDDVASISSGPCAPDPITAAALLTELERSRLWERLPEAARRHLARAARGDVPDTPKPSDRAFEHVMTRVIVSNAQALAAAGDGARAAGIDEVTVVAAPLTGEAAIAGVRLASDLIARRKRARGPRIARCVIWGGETTVTFADRAGPSAGVLGGRNQELALAAARSLFDAGDHARDITILAAGTDGRDGPTDAAGAIVDSLTWAAVTFAGRDPAADLAAHNAYPALDAGGALLRTGHTGTNVMDVVIGLVL